MILIFPWNICIKFIKTFYILIFLIFPLTINAGINKAIYLYNKNGANKNYYTDIIYHLLKDNYTYTSMPFLFDLMNASIKGNLKRRPYDIEEITNFLMEQMAQKISLSSFEIYTKKELSYFSNEYSIILRAKKLFKEKKYQDVFKLLLFIPKKHFLYPFAIHLQAIAKYHLNQINEAIDLLDVCTKESELLGKKIKENYRKDQVQWNRDFCFLAKGRIYFDSKLYSKAEQEFAQISIKSAIWPIVQVEMAKSYYFEKRYNEGLGKLWAFNLPILMPYISPELFFYKAKSLEALCLWDELGTTINFYKNYYKNLNLVKKQILKLKNDPKKFLSWIFNPNTKSRPEWVTNFRERSLLLPVMRHNKLDYDLIRNELKNLEFKLFVSREIKDNYLTIKRVLMKGLNSMLKFKLRILIKLIKRSIIQEMHDIQQVGEFMSELYVKQIKDRKYLINILPKVFRETGDPFEVVEKKKRFYWPFDKEIWIDELGNHVYKYQSDCLEK